jgi:hypothetical protein
MKKSLLIFLQIILILVFLGCVDSPGTSGDFPDIDGDGTDNSDDNDIGDDNEPDLPVVYSVKYYANGADSGDVPVDSNSYEESESFTILRNEGGLLREGYLFAGWNSAADGQDNTYYPNDLSVMQSAKFELYAVWLSSAELNDRTAKNAAPDFEVKSGAWLGYSVDISENYLIAGAYRERDDLYDTYGSVFIYQKTGDNSWGNHVEIMAPDGVEHDQFGFSVAISDEYAAIGANLVDVGGLNDGAIYIYSRSGPNEWTYTDKITPTDATNSDEFGSSIAIDGDYIVVGSPSHDIVPSNSGAAYIFHRTEGNIWDADVTKIWPSDRTQNDEFGNAVSIDGSCVIVGCWSDDDKGIRTGSAYIFRRTGTNNWIEEDKLTASDPGVNDYFGVSVDICENYAIVGSYYNDDGGTDSGSAYIYNYNGSDDWGDGIKLNASDAAAGDEFGRSVAINTEYAFIGANLDDDMGTDSGAVYIFHRVGSNSWDTGTKILDSDGTGGDSFGNALAVNGKYAAVGAYLDSSDFAGTTVGSVSVVQYR